MENVTKVTLTSAQLTEAANVSKEIEALQERLAGILGGTVNVSGVTSNGTPDTKRKMSPAARKKIAAAATARWAKYHAEKAKATAPVAVAA